MIFCFFVHHIPVEYRHCMIFIYKLWLTVQFLLFPQFQSRLIGRQASKRMLNRRSAKIRWHLWKFLVKVISRPVFLCAMNQMLRCIKPFLRIDNPRKLLPALFTYTDQISDCLAIDIQRMANRYILFFYFHTIAGYYLHQKPLYFPASFSFCPLI